jgi:hypothetical protein
MAIQRQSIKSGLASGNFGRPGTPLPSVRPSAGPDLSRLAQSLGVGIQSAVGKVQQEDTAAARAAIQEAIQRTTHSTPEERTQVLNTIRDQFDDQNLFMKLFTDENPAVKVMDDVTGMSKALETKNALLAASEKNKHLPLEEQQEIQRKILEEASVFSKGISEGTHRAYLNSIHTSALQIDAQNTAAWVERNKQESMAQINDTYFRADDDFIAASIQMQSEMMNSNLTSFEAGRASFLNNLASIKTNVAKHAEDQFKKLMVVGDKDKISAGTAVTDRIITLAERFNSPELLDILHDKSVRGAGGQPLGNFHAKQIAEARERITRNAEKKRVSLMKLETERRAAAYEEFKAGIDARLSGPIKESLADGSNTEKKEVVRRAIAEEKRALELASEQPNWNKSFVQTQNLKNMILDQEIKYEKSMGDDVTEAKVQEMLANRTYTKDSYRLYAPYLSPVTKARLEAVTEPLRKADDMATEKAITDRLKSEDAKLETLRLDVEDTFKLDDVDSTNLDRLIKGGIPVPNLDPKRLKLDITETLSSVESAIWDKEKRAATFEEREAAVKTVMDRWNKKVETRSKMLKTYKEGNPEKVEASASFEALYEGDSLSDSELQNYKKSGPKILKNLKPEDKARFYTTRQNGAIQELQGMEVTSIVQGMDVMKEWFGENMDLSKENQRVVLGNILARGMFRGRIFTGSGTSGLFAPAQHTTTDDASDLVKSLDPMMRFFERVGKTPFEAAGLIETFSEEVANKLMDGSLLTVEGLEAIQKKYPSSGKLFEGLGEYILPIEEDVALLEPTVEEVEIEDDTKD